jgi:hypothetical protein
LGGRSCKGPDGGAEGLGTNWLLTRYFKDGKFISMIRLFKVLIILVFLAVLYKSAFDDLRQVEIERCRVWHWQICDEILK